jgi:hypothetical protein
MTNSQIIYVIIAGGAIITSIITAVAAYYNNRANAKWKSNTDKDLANIQSDLARSNNTVNSLLSLFGSNYQESQQRRILAIENLWTNLLKFNNIVPIIGHAVYNVLTEEEVENYIAHLKHTQIIDDNTLIGNDADANYRKSLRYTEEIDKQRPFLDEKIWFYYNLYATFVGRISYSLIEQAKRQAFRHWHKDTVTKNLLQKSLMKEELEYIYSNKTNSLKITLAFL